MNASAAEIRRILGVVYCPTCKVDTMPLERTGCCAFCDTRLVADRKHDVAEPEPEPTVAFCPECDTMFELSRPNRMYCSKKCKNEAYYRTVKGQAFLAQKNVRKHATLKATRIAARELREANADHGSVARYTAGCRCPRCLGAWSQRHTAARLNEAVA